MYSKFLSLLLQQLFACSLNLIFKARPNLPTYWIPQLGAFHVKTYTCIKVYVYQSMCEFNLTLKVLSLTTELMLELQVTRGVRKVSGRVP